MNATTLTLSDDEILAIFDDVDDRDGLLYSRLMIEFGRAVEAAVRAKGTDAKAANVQHMEQTSGADRAKKVES